MYTNLLIFLACSSDFTDSTPAVVATADDPTAVATEPDADPIAVPVVASTTLTVTLDPDTDGYLEVRPWTENVAGDITVGLALATTEITSDEMVLELPSAIPARDDIRGSTEPVLYAIAMQRIDPNGAPGSYSGLTDAQLAWIPADPDSGAAAGWDLVLRYGQDDEQWLAMEDGVRMGENLIGPKFLTLNGGSAVPMTPATHLTLGAVRDGALQAYDAPIAPSWTASLATAPGVEVLDDTEKYEGVLLSPYSYDDEDGDNAWTGEPITGRICLGPDEAVVTWIAEARDLATAVTLARIGVRSGWDLMADTDAGLRPATEDQRIMLNLTETCE